MKLSLDGQPLGPWSSRNDDDDDDDGLAVITTAEERLTRHAGVDSGPHYEQVLRSFTEYLRVSVTWRSLKSYLDSHSTAVRLICKILT